MLRANDHIAFKSVARMYCIEFADLYTEPVAIAIAVVEEVVGVKAVAENSDLK